MRCAGCGADKAVEEFHWSVNPKTSRPQRCKVCRNARARARIRNRWGDTRHYHLMQRYGISAAEVERMKAAHGGICLVCGERPAAHVDHDHATGIVRGILCEPCNGFLGAFNDDPDLLRAAITYLEKPR